MFRHTLFTKLARLSVPMLFISLIGGVTAVIAQDTAVSPQGKPPLQGSVVHDETLPGLPNQYQVGTQFDQTDLQGLTPDNMWFPVPNWFAGKWHGENKSFEYVEDCKTGLYSSPHLVVKEASDVIHGHQRDKTGQIWEFIKVPYWQKVKELHTTGYMRALREDVLQSDSSQVVLKILNNQMTVADNTQKIVDSNQVQQIGTYIPVEDGLMKLEASLKNFDGQGHPIQLQRCSKLMKRTSPYENIDSLNGLDLKQLFAEFLKKTGRTDLLPNTPQ